MYSLILIKIARIKIERLLIIKLKVIFKFPLLITLDKIAN